MILKNTACKSRILLDVDTQRHFFQKDSNVCIRNPERIRNNIQRVLTWAWDHHVTVLSTVQLHRPQDSLGLIHQASYLSSDKLAATESGKVIQFQATDATDLPIDLIETYDQVVFQKRTFDPFAEPRFDRLLSNLNVDEILLMGCPKEGAILATLSGLLTRQHSVTLVGDAIGTLNNELGQFNRERVDSKAVRTIKTRDLLKQHYPLAHAV